jgi:purine-binding chemotaxis protein CheW
MSIGKSQQGLASESAAKRIAGASADGSMDASATSARAAQDYVCVFVLGRERFAVSTKLLQEVVRDLVVETVPLTPPHILGIFNLRGTPTVLLDTEILLRDMRTRTELRSSALVLGDVDLRVALSVDRVDGIVAIDSSRVMAAPEGGAEYCWGYVELPGQDGFVALISSEFLLQRITALQPTSRSNVSSIDPTEIL